MSDGYEFDFDLVDDLFAPAKKKIEDAQKEEIRQLVEDMKTILGLPEGRRVIWWVLARGNLFASTYTGRALDSAHLDGQRIIAAEVLSLALKADPLILSKLVEQKLFKQE